METLETETRRSPLIIIKKFSSNYLKSIRCESRIGMLFSELVLNRYKPPLGLVSASFELLGFGFNLSVTRFKKKSNKEEI